MIKKQLCLLILCLPLLAISSFVSAQDDKGIRWTTGLSWEQIKEKAKAENKYIFVDCYATWCGPCKVMNKNVFTADSVGEFFNEKFISVKVQMDKTKNDNDETKKWYTDADSIKRKYHVEGYPTFLFFNPNGQVTEKKVGYKEVGEFVSIGKSAIVPNKLYRDPYADYYKNLTAYKVGERNYDAYPSMIRAANKLGDTSIAKQLRKELTDYVSTLPTKQRYTKGRIEFWYECTELFVWSSASRVFGFFYNDNKLINKVMNRKGYAEDFVDKTIQFEIVLPFLKDQNKGSRFSMEGGHMTYTGGGNPSIADTRESDWIQLEKMIRSKYGRAYAKRNVLKARVEWYTRHLNKNAVVEYTLKLFNVYKPDLNEVNAFVKINEPAWDAFLSSNDKKILKGYAKWMKKVVLQYPRADCIDTYANLLYKLGDRKKAIKWQEKAVKLWPNDNSLLVTLQQMKDGKPTYTDLAIWE